MAVRRSNRRQKQAAATRRDILEAARKLFVTHGYVGTSIAAIAAEADTAVQTIYDSVGPKRAIILAIVELSEEKAGVESFRQRIMDTDEPREAIALFVALTRQFMEHGSDIIVAMRAAALSEPDVAEALERASRQHRQGARVVAELLARLGALKPGIPVEQAADVIGVLTWSSTWLEFTGTHGWTFDACERWLNDSIATLLLRGADDKEP